QVLDVCLANPDRDEADDTDRFMTQITRKVKVPLMIDSTDARVIEIALRHCQGKSIVNSINLEDGEERFEKVVPLLRAYGGAVVVGCIDENKQQGMAVTRQRKLAIAERSYELLTGKYGVPARDLIFDALVFPVGTGDANYIGSAVETIEGSRDGRIDDLNAKLRDAAPLAIINGPLMRGMDEVGRLFNDNQLIVAEVLQSAEAMKAAVAHLEPFMEKAESATRGTIVLATVKGDVHDIGKNLVEIIFGNNGYR